MFNQQKWGSSLVRRFSPAPPPDPFQPGFTSGWGTGPQMGKLPTDPGNPWDPGAGGNTGDPTGGGGGPGGGKGVSPFDPFYNWIPGGAWDPPPNPIPESKPDPIPPPPTPSPPMPVGPGGLRWMPPGWMPPPGPPPPPVGSPAYDAGSRFRRMGGAAWTNIDDSPMFGQTNAPKPANPQTDPFQP